MQALASKMTEELEYLKQAGSSPSTPAGNGNVSSVSGMIKHLLGTYAYNTLHKMFTLQWRFQCFYEPCS